MSFTGKDLIGWGFEPGEWFKQAIFDANALADVGMDLDGIIEELRQRQPVKMLARTHDMPWQMFLDAENDLERDNAFAVAQHMDALLRTPTIKTAAVMPDACPAGSQLGTIPVGGAVACENAIHPGFHSADICCSMFATIFKRDMDPKDLLDAVQKITHFGPGRRLKPIGGYVYGHALEANPFLKGLDVVAQDHFGTQGDGNHFAFVGRRKSDGKIALVTHHGSRGFGAQVYKRGMAVAKKHWAKLGKPGAEHNAWIVADSEDGEDYWQALQYIRMWTKSNHQIIHDTVAQTIGNRVHDRFWNEHNFVFQRSDGLFYHGKGATPAWRGFAKDDSGLRLIPMNMAEPILIMEAGGRADALDFAPHGAGRNMGRKTFLRENKPELPKGIDARFFCGLPDPSEYPDAYKNAASVRAQIQKFKLANVVDEIVPYGSIMAGEWDRDAPWKKGRAL